MGDISVELKKPKRKKTINITKNNLSYLFDEYMTRRELSQIQLVKDAGIDQSSFSKAMNGSRRFPLTMALRIGEKLQIPDKELLTTFGLDCNRKECIEEFVVFCIVQKKKEYCEGLVENTITKGRSQVETIFNIAEKVFQLAEKKKAESHKLKESGSTIRAKNAEECWLYLYRESYKLFDLLYDMITYQKTSEKLTQLSALSAFRICTIARFLDDADLAYSAVLQLIPQIDNLDDPRDKNEAYRQVIARYYVLGKWKKVFYYSDILASISKETDPIQYGNALIYKARAAVNTGNYDIALKLTDEYGKIDSEDFRRWAEGNRFNIQVEMGDLSIIPEYLDWLKRHREEALGGIPSILCACVREGNLDIFEQVMSNFANEIEAYCKPTVDPWKMRQYLQFLLAKSEYLLHKGEISEGFEILCFILSNSIRRNFRKVVVESMKVYNAFIPKFGKQQINQFAEVLNDLRFNE